jgi:dTDP-4-amino-4,6-dideoxygalactose transaminase
MDPILDTAKRRRLKIIEDSCETMFVSYKGRPVGSFGEMGCFSTYVAHLLVTGVGGLITTNSDRLAVMCRSILAHGRDSIYLNIDDDDSVSDERRFSMIVNRRFSFVRMGYSYRVTEFEGALGLAAFEKKDEMMRVRRQNGRYLIERLKPFEEYLQLPTWPDYSTHAFMMFPVVVKKGVRRGPLVNYLEQQGVETRFMFPLLSQPFYRKLFGDLEKSCPVARYISRAGFYIGCHQGLTRDDLDYVVQVFQSYFKTLK